MQAGASKKSDSSDIKPWGIVVILILLVMALAACRSIYKFHPPTAKELSQIDHIQYKMSYQRNVWGIAHFHAGTASFKKGNLKQAYDHWKRASTMIPVWDLPLLQLAILHPLYDNDRVAELASLKRAMELNPNNPRTHLMLGIVYLQQNEYDKAEDQFTEVIRQKPNNEEAHLRLANMYREQNRIEEAIVKYEWLTEKQPLNAMIFSLLASLYEQTKQMKKAELAYSRLLGLQNDRSYAYYKLGKFFERQGRMHEARHAFKKSEQLKPKKKKRKMRPLLPSRR